MNKLAFSLRKLNNPITYAVTACTVGIAFIVLPPALLDIVILVLGALISAVALCLLISWAFVAEDNAISALVKHGALIKSTLLLLFGAGLMLVRSSVSGAVCSTLGVLLALYSVFRLCRPARNTLERGVGWHVEGIILVLLIILGVLVAIAPLWPKITAGVALLAFGLKLVYDIISDMLKKRRIMGAKPRIKRPKDIYSADFVDKSDKL